MKLVVLAAFCMLAAPAFAQEGLPRFEGLEQQQRDLQQREFDKLGQQQQNELDRLAQPNSGATAADRAMRELEFQRQRDQLLLQAEQNRALKQRELDLAAAALPNASVAPSSSAVVTDPQRYILPPAPKGQYYARLDGHFVLVDSTSQRVVGILAAQPTDPTADVPAQPLPLPDTSLPVRRISPTSALVLQDFGRWSLPPPPKGQYYANINGRIVLVDDKTELALRFVDGR